MKNIEIQLLAQDAARTYVQSGAGLNETIAKIAQDKGLTRVEIDSLVAAANHATSDGLRKVAAKGGHEFDLASADTVLELLGRKEEGTPVQDIYKIASGMAQGRGSTLQRDLDRIDPKTPELYEAEKRATLLHLEKIASRADNYSRMLVARSLGVREEFRDAMGDLMKLAKEYIYSNRGTLAEMHKYAQCLTPDTPGCWTPIFQAVQQELRKEAHPTNVALANATELAAPDSFERSGGRLGGPDVTVINGRAALAGTLTQVKQKIDTSEDLLDWKREVDNLSTTIRDIQQVVTDNESAQPQIQKFASDLDTWTATTDGFINVIEASMRKTAAANDDVKNMSKSYKPHSLRQALTEGASQATTAGLGQLTRDYIPGTHQSKATAAALKGTK